MINFFAPINNLGYGVHAYNFMKALDATGVDIALFPISNKVLFRTPLIDKWEANSKKFNKEDVSLMLFHEFEMHKFYGKKRIGFPVFETGIEKEHFGYLSSLDFILQPSWFGKKYLLEHGFKNVFIVPEGFDQERYNLSLSKFNDKIKILNERGVIFSTVGKLEKRKSSLDILHVFTQALDGINVRCTLLAHMYNPFLEDWLDRITDELINKLEYAVIQNAKNTITFERSNLRIVVPKYPIKDIRDIYVISHFGIYASKAEGWNLPLIESIASGIPCLTTSNTAQGDYLVGYPEELLIPTERVEVANDGIWFHGTKGEWCIPDFVAMKNKLAYLAKNAETFLDKRTECFNSVKDFTWENSAKKFIEFSGQVNISI